mgnify:CR=1 FL=1
MKKSERLFNICVGISVLSWALFGIIADIERFCITPVRISVALINLFVGFIFFIRKPLIRQGTISSIILSLPSFLASGFAYKIVQPTNIWPKYAELLFIIGAFFTIVSFVYLGRCFAVFPSVRGVVTTGPYRIVRHPAYLGELIMILACLLAKPGLVCLPFIMGVTGIAIRIIFEEKVMLEHITYKKYTEAVNWRLLPGIW